MIAIPLQSGSNGNSVYVESGDVKLLIDAGISGKQAEARLKANGRDIRDVTALLITHDHIDHAKCAGIFSRKFNLPVYMTKPTWKEASVCHNLGEIADLRFFSSGDTLRFNGVSVESVPTAHDGADGSVFVVADDRHRLGVLTDLGHVFDGLGEVLESLHGVFLESNYDPDMLRVSHYPPMVKERIKGDGGHISNEESAGLIKEFGRRLRWACLAHLSENNNHPARAMRCHHEIVGRRTQLFTASRYECSGVFSL